MDDYIPFLLIPIIYYGVRYNRLKKNKWNTLTKFTLSFGTITYSITEIGRSFYRPYVYSNNINDYYIADTLGNTFGTMTAIFIILTLSGTGTNRDWKLIAILVIGLILYEFLNLTGKTAIDINDIIATIIFTVISSIIYFLVVAKVKKEK